MLMLILVASLGAYAYQWQRQETLKHNLLDASWTTYDGVEWAKIDCEEPDFSRPYSSKVLSGIWLKKFEMGWIDLQCNGKIKRFSRTNPSRGNAQERAKIKGYEDTVGNLLQ